MEEPRYDAVVLRMGEVFLKRDNRQWFVNRLLDRLAALLEGLPWRMRSYQGRVLLTPAAGADPELTLDDVLERVSRCFGISSYSPVVMASQPDPDELARIGAALAEATVPPCARTFRVTSRRPDKRLPFTSTQLNAIVGSAVNQATGLGVDLSRPDFVVGVEAGRPAFVFTRSEPGPGGLPLGSSGKGLLLLSGGIDSPVAAWRMLKRGCPLEAIHFHSPPYTGPAALEKVLELGQAIARWGGPLTIHLVPMTELQLQVKQKARAAYTVLLYRRFMVRVACRIARQRKALSLVSGDSLGQVASQTMENLACIQAVSDRPILRPLIAFDKEETVKLARQIGTYDISIRPFEDSCSLFVPRHPEIHGRIRDLEQAEEPLPLEELVDKALEETETVRVGEQGRID